MDKYISREEVLDIALQYCPDDDGSCSKADVDLREMLDEIEALPAADVQPVKRGKWEAQLNGHVFCTYCGKEQAFSSDFCKHCGADMRYPETIKG